MCSSDLPENLNLLFPGGRGGSWNQLFGFITPQFLQQYIQFIPQVPIPQPPVGVLIPSSLINFFKDGQMNWLNPDRFALLQGGRWDIGLQRWITNDGRQIAPGSLEWTAFFGDLKPDLLNVWFPNGGAWNERFGFINGDFFKNWNGWQPPKIDFGFLPGSFVQFMNGGQLGW